MQEDIFNVERRSPKTGQLVRGMSQSKNSQGFSIDPIPIHQQTPQERTMTEDGRGRKQVHPGFRSLLPNENDDQTERYSSRRRNRNRDSEFDPNEESKHYTEDVAGGYYSKHKNPNVDLGEDIKLPFKIYRPCSTLWKNDETGQRNQAGTLTKDSIFIECSEAIDAINNSQRKFNEIEAGEDKPEEAPLHTNNIIKKIFRDIKINAKVNEHCIENKIKNDFKSINIDTFIESFNQTYPQYLTLIQTK